MAQRASTSQIVAQSINLTKNLIGAGIFTLPSALMDGSVVPGLLVMALVGVVQGSTFIMIAYLCEKLKQTTYRGAWCAVFGKRSGDIVDACITINGFFACVAYKILVADFLVKALEGLFGMQDASRSWIIWLNTIAITLPLSHARNLEALSYTSMLGLLIIAFVFLYVVVDFLCNLDVAFDNLSAQAMRPGMGMFSTLALCTGAFQAHYNAPKMYQELGCDLKALSTVVLAAFGMSFVIYSSFAVAGLGLFGDAVMGNVLRNYESNTAVLCSWFGMAFAIIFTYPLVFTTGRDSLIGMVPALQRLSKKYPLGSHVTITSSMIAAISAFACIVDDVSVVTGLLGATIGSLLCWIFPALVYLKATHKASAAGSGREPLLPKKNDDLAKNLARNELLAGYSKGMVLVGFLSMLVGVAKTLGAI